MSSAQIKNSFSSIGEVEADIPPNTLNLKLAVTSDSMRYFVVSQTHHQVIFYGDYTLHHINSASDMCTAIRNIFEKDEILKLPFAKIVIGFDEKYNLVPIALSDGIKSPGQISNRCSDIEIIFDIESELLSLLKQLFQDPEFFHLNTVYFNLLPGYLHDSPDKLFVNVGKTSLDLIRFTDQKDLLLMNRYAYRTAADFIYFVLLCCEELKIDREATTLVLIGEVDIQSKIYDQCYRFFQAVTFIQKPDQIHFSKALDLYPKHMHFNLYNLNE